jgi:antirestriction protein ArdC
MSFRSAKTEVTEHVDVYQRITARVIAMLESADPAKAESPWVSLGKRGRPGRLQ